MTDVLERHAIRLGRGAAADGSGIESVAGDHDGVLQAVDAIAECGNRMTCEVARGDLDAAKME